MMTSPLITVVTVSLNAVPSVEQTIRSVLDQTWSPLELIIVDGASTDGTWEIISKYRSRLAHAVSEKDDGIADAMNKGIALAKGDFIVFLHADDYFHNVRSLEQAMAFCSAGSDIIACDILFGRKLERYTPRGFNWWFNFKTGVFHQGVICRRTLLEKLGGFDKQFRIAMDYDFFLRAYRSGVCLARAPVVLSVMRDTGISTRADWDGLAVRFDEEKRVHEKNCRSFPMRQAYALYWFFYLPYRKVRYIMKNRRRC